MDAVITLFLLKYNLTFKRTIEQIIWDEILSKLYYRHQIFFMKEKTSL